MTHTPPRKPCKAFRPPQACKHARLAAAIYDGRTRAGAARRGERAVEALDARGKSPGFFHSTKAAADAVSAAAPPSPAPVKRDGLAQLRALGRARRTAP